MFADIGAASTLYVDDDGNQNYTTIQEAIDNATPGDTIIVSPGVYIENVDVYKEVILMSEGGEPADTFVYPDDPDYDVFYVDSDNVTVGGFTIRGAVS
ncbi:hypothetical protein FTO70_01010 [Methanosarcina sp. KYL-1]|uniref:hypothetical protein n=1 Tax=Methanosarcina sp. KYL-1 TaxID=2602068 RepID=UPI0021017739|nr:hypothetical protein [Methanosarcina sp. KYL-1]MCQ1534299.1 hypothetical protein [Methanosarcina sp. KYL-1]